MGSTVPRIESFTGIFPIAEGESIFAATGTVVVVVAVAVVDDTGASVGLELETVGGAMVVVVVVVVVVGIGRRLCNLRRWRSMYFYNV